MLNVYRVAGPSPEFGYRPPLILFAAMAIGAGGVSVSPPVLSWAQSSSGSVPALDGVTAFATSSLRPVVDRFNADWAALQRRWSDIPYSAARQRRLEGFLAYWSAALDGLDVEADDVEGSIDLVLLSNEVRYRRGLLQREESLVSEMLPLLPFLEDMVNLLDIRHSRRTVDGAVIAGNVTALAAAVRRANHALRPGGGHDTAVADGAAGRPVAATPVIGLRAVQMLGTFEDALVSWYRHYEGYEPLYTWWVSAPFRELEEALGIYRTSLREVVVGWREGDDEPIVGDPIGRAGMEADLVHDMIPYTPEELVSIAQREFEWLDARMLEASRELGYGDDWRAALEHVKTRHAPPGGQPQVVLQLAREATDFVEARGLVTIPELAKEVWRLEMMSPERQRVSPFFLGGEVIRVSFPTDAMTHDEKLMSMRGNNIHFSRATVHHELIPGHHLQGFMTERYNPHRNLFRTPFWGEGWALYWEMRLWDLGFPATAEDRVGMLFWRMHRAARIIFSLSFHLGEMTPEDAIAFLVHRIGHEPANAAAEVRRSFNGTYSPLYQAAYMLGGLQIRALHEQFVQGGVMAEREFHDAILRGGRMPIEMVRARLMREAPERDFRSRWRFYGDPLSG